MRVLDAVQAINRAYGTTVLLVTHDPLVASRVDRVVTVRDGRTSTEIRRHRNGGDGHLHEEEWVILDPVGRLQRRTGPNGSWVEYTYDETGSIIIVVGVGVFGTLTWWPDASGFYLRAGLGGGNRQRDGQECLADTGWP